MSTQFSYQVDEYERPTIGVMNANGSPVGVITDHGDGVHVFRTNDRQMPVTVTAVELREIADKLDELGGKR